MGKTFGCAGRALIPLKEVLQIRKAQLNNHFIYHRWEYVSVVIGQARDCSPWWLAGIGYMFWLSGVCAFFHSDIFADHES